MSDIFTKQIEELEKEIEKLELKSLETDDSNEFIELTYKLRTRRGKLEAYKEAQKIFRDFIKFSESRIKNQLRIHWVWLKNKSHEEISDFIINIIKQRAGDLE